MTIHRHHVLLAVPSVAAWILLSGSAIPGLPAFCGLGVHPGAEAIAGIMIALRVNPIGPLLLSWLLMLCAMMLPLLGAPIAGVYALEGSRPRRGLSVLAFLISYTVVWMAVMLVLAIATAGLRLVTVPSPILAPSIAIVVMVAWQRTAIKARCLRLCSDGPPLPGSRLAPELRGLRHGIDTARACVGSGWALMALPFLFEAGHFPAMVMAAIVMGWERRGPGHRGRDGIRWGRAVPG